MRRQGRVMGGMGLAIVLLAGCAAGPDYQRPEGLTPAAWHASLPHQGAPETPARWWDGFGDPLLSALIDQAQQTHPSIDSALAVLRESRAQLGLARSGYFPALGGSASQTRSSGGAGAGTPDLGALDRGSASLDAAWEWDLFGGTRRSVEAGRARAAAREWEWHGAQVSLAAEVAGAYLARRQCERLLGIADDALHSREETARLTRLRVGAGFNAPAEGAQAEAVFSDSRSARLQQQAQCALNLNQLVALTGQDAAQLQARLAAEAGRLPLPAQPLVPGVPAQALSQRPDVAAAERSLQAASADIGVSIADRLPSLTLVGAIGANRLRVGGSTVIDHSWSFGPSITLPLFDGGRRAAAVEAARARYDAALAGYRGRVRLAVREVEDALVRLDSALAREESAALAESRYAEFLASAEERYGRGAISLLDLEDARRLALGSRQSLVGVQAEISQSWVALYKAVGGGWAAFPAETVAHP